MTVADLRSRFTAYAEVSFDLVPFGVLETCSKASKTIFPHSDFIAYNEDKFSVLITFSVQIFGIAFVDFDLKVQV